MTNEQRKKIADYRQIVFSRIYEENENLPPNLKKAKALAEYLRTKPIYIDEGEIIAGNGQFVNFNHAHMGARTSALPSGRKAGISLANGFSPCQGVDLNGPTAVLNSTAKCNLNIIGNGIVVDLKFQPQFFKKNRNIIRDMIEAHFEEGGYEVQINVVDRQTLINAQMVPDKYRNLIVRVSGFSAYFVELGVIIQNEIIARTKHM